VRPSGSAIILDARRLRGAEYFQERKPLQEIASRLGVDLSSVKRWKRTRLAEGVEGLASKPHPGRPSRLSEEQRQSLVTMLLARPAAAGYRTDLWTCKRVAQVVWKRFGVKYHPDHIRKILHDLGFSPQKPRRVAREQDALAVQQWRTNDWPCIKKRRKDAAQP
jgi:transposase